MTHKATGWHRQHGAYPSRSDVPPVRSTGPIDAPKTSWWATPSGSREDFMKARDTRWQKPSSQQSPK